VHCVLNLFITLSFVDFFFLINMDSVTRNRAILQKQSPEEPEKNIVTVLMKAAGTKFGSFFGLEKCCFTQ